MRALVTVLPLISTQTFPILEEDDMGIIFLWDNLLYSAGAKKFITIYVMDKEAIFLICTHTVSFLCITTTIDVRILKHVRVTRVSF